MDKKELIDFLERFKVVLISIATGDSVDGEEFKELRNQAINIKELSNILPQFVFSCRTPREFFVFIQGKFKHYKERSAFITEEMNKVIAPIEMDSSPSINVYVRDYKYDVFISHNSKDKELAIFLVDFLIGLGISKEKIFFTSLTETGVDKSIRKDIKEALQTSKYFFIVVSDNYFHSTYCLNEEGAIWFATDNFVIFAESSFDHKDLDGFLNDDNIIRRFDNVEDFKRVYKNLSKVLDLNIFDDSLNSIIDKTVYDYKLYKYTKENGELTEREKKIVEIVYHNNRARARDISDLLNISIDLAIQLLIDLIDKKIIAKRTDGKHIYYTIAL